MFVYCEELFASRPVRISPLSVGGGEERQERPCSFCAALKAQSAPKGRSDKAILHINSFEWHLDLTSCVTDFYCNSRVSAGKFGLSQFVVPVLQRPFKSTGAAEERYLDVLWGLFLL